MAGGRCYSNCSRELGGLLSLCACAGTAVQRDTGIGLVVRATQSRSRSDHRNSGSPALEPDWRFALGSSLPGWRFAPERHRNPGWLLSDASVGPLEFSDGAGGLHVLEWCAKKLESFHWQTSLVLPDCEQRTKSPPLSGGPPDRVSHTAHCSLHTGGVRGFGIRTSYPQHRSVASRRVGARWQVGNGCYRHPCQSRRM